MKSFPKVPVMLGPFCKDGDKTEDFSLDVEARNSIGVSYNKGIPIQYSIPKDSGGSPITRQLMNRLMYNATVGTFMHEVGYPITFDPDLSTAINGYPLGANLKWVRLVRDDRYDMPKNWKFPSGGVPKIKDIKTPQIGDVATSEDYVTDSNPDGSLDTSKNDYGGLYVYGDITDSSGTKTQKWFLVNVESIASVVSMIENNNNDFRTDGPTWKSKDDSGNGWAYAAGTVHSGFWPDYSQLTDGNLVYTKDGTTTSATSDKIKIETKGWLVLKATRKIDTSSFTTLGQLMTCYSDGIACSLWPPECSEAQVMGARQFGGGDTIIITLPVPVGTIAVFTLKNQSSSSISFKVWNIGTTKE